MKARRWRIEDENTRKITKESYKKRNYTNRREQGGKKKR